MRLRSQASQRRTASREFGSEASAKRWTCLTSPLIVRNRSVLFVRAARSGSQIVGSFVAGVESLAGNRAHVAPPWRGRNAGILSILGESFAKSTFSSGDASSPLHFGTSRKAADRHHADNCGRDATGESRPAQSQRPATESH